MKTCAASFREAALSWFGRIARYFCLVPYDRNLLPLIPHPAPFQGEHHIRGADKVALVLFPADAAFAVTQADKLLLHAPTAVWTPFLAQNGPPRIISLKVNNSDISRLRDARDTIAVGQQGQVLYLLVEP